MTHTLADYDLVLALVAYAVAVLGALAGLFTGRYVRDPEGNIRVPWLVLCALLLSACMMWAAHFVAVLAWDPGVPVTFGLKNTLLSLVMSAIFTLFAVLIVTRNPDSRAVLWVGGATMTMGIVALHYGGMAGLRVPHAIVHDTLLVTASIFLAFGVSTAALYVLSRVDAPARYLGVPLMGAAVAAMHLAGMAGLEVGAPAEVEYFAGAITSPLMAMVVAAIALITAVLGIALGAVGYLQLHAQPSAELHRR